MDCKAQQPVDELEDAESESQELFDRSLALCNMNDYVGARQLLETRVLSGESGAFLHRWHAIAFNAYLALVGVCGHLEDFAAQTRHVFMSAGMSTHVCACAGMRG